MKLFKKIDILLHIIFRCQFDSKVTEFIGLNAFIY